MGNPAIEQSQSSMENQLSGGIGMNHTTWQSQNGKTIYFIRHAEAKHNVLDHNGPDYTLRDPRLTNTGVLQAQRIRDAIPMDVLANIQLIVTSPLQRSIHSCLLAFRNQIEWKTVPVVINKDLQETSILPCDTGSSRAQLIEAFPQLESEIREGLAEDDWFQKSSNDCLPSALNARARQFMKWLMDRKERVIVVMAHNGILRYLLGDQLWNEQGNTPDGFSNAEVRRYAMQTDDGVLTKSGIRVMERTISHEFAAIGHID